MHTVFPMGIMASSNCMRTHTCYDRCYLREHLLVITPISGDTLVSGVVTDIASLGHTCITTEVHAVLHEVSF